MFAMFPPHTLRERAGPHIHINIFPVCSKLQYMEPSSSCGSTVHVALSLGAIPSFAVLHTEKLAFQCATLLS